MARAYLTDVCKMQEIAEHFGVHHSAVSRAGSQLFANAFRRAIGRIDRAPSMMPWGATHVRSV
jgi:hypothetical protein